MRDLSLAISSSLDKKRANSPASTKVLNISILIAIVFFGLLYLFQINSLGTKGYEIQKLQQEIKVLGDQQKSLQIQASNLQSISRIQEQATALNFVPSTNVTYLKNSDFALK